MTVNHRLAQLLDEVAAVPGIGRALSFARRMPVAGPRIDAELGSLIRRDPAELDHLLERVANLVQWVRTGDGDRPILASANDDDDVESD